MVHSPGIGPGGLGMSSTGRWADSQRKILPHLFSVGKTRENLHAPPWSQNIIMRTAQRKNKKKTLPLRLKQQGFGIGDYRHGLYP